MLLNIRIITWQNAYTYKLYLLLACVLGTYTITEYLDQNII